MHGNTQIRNALAARVTGLPSTGSNVGNSVYPENARKTLRVFFESEALPDELQTMARVHYRIATYKIEIRVRENSPAEGEQGFPLQDEIDQIRSEVEAAIAADETLGGLPVKVRYLGTGTAQYEQGSDKPAGFLDLIFEVHHRTTAADPNTLIG